MPKITLTIGTASWSHDVTAQNATRIVTILAANRGIPATAEAVCPVIARELFRSIKSEVQEKEQRSVPVADIPATES